MDLQGCGPESPSNYCKNLKTQRIAIYKFKYFWRQLRKDLQKGGTGCPEKSKFWGQKAGVVCSIAHSPKGCFAQSCWKHRASSTVNPAQQHWMGPLFTDPSPDVPQTRELKGMKPLPQGTQLGSHRPRAVQLLMLCCLHHTSHPLCSSSSLTLQGNEQTNEVSSMGFSFFI